MEHLINKSIGFQNRGFDELESWTKLLSESQKKLLKAYNTKNNELSELYQKEIDFIQKQIIRLK